MNHRRTLNVIQLLILCCICLGFFLPQAEVSAQATSSDSFEFHPLQNFEYGDGEYLYEDRDLPGPGDVDAPGMNGVPGVLNTIIRIAIGVSTLLALAMFVYGGFLYATKDSTKNTSEGLAVIRRAILGLMFSVSSVVLLNTINPDILNLNVLAPVDISVDDPGVLEGWSLEETAAWGGGGGLTAPSGTAQELAQAIMESDNITGKGNYMNQIRRIAEGREGCYVSPKILQLILAMSQRYSFYITSLNRRCTGVLTASGTGSYHYAGAGGRAVDFDNINGVNIMESQQGRTVSKQFAEDAMRLPLPNNSGIGQSGCGMGLSVAPGIRHFSDTCNHLHIEIP